jgi:hypothetical protein
MKAMDQRLNGEIKAVDQRLSGEIKALDLRMIAGFEKLDTKIDQKIGKLDEKFDKLKDSLSSAKIWALGMYISLAGSMLYIIAKSAKWF